VESRGVRPRKAPGAKGTVTPAATQPANAADKHGRGVVPRASLPLGGNKGPWVVTGRPYDLSAAPSRGAAKEPRIMRARA